MIIVITEYRNGQNGGFDWAPWSGNGGRGDFVNWEGRLNRHGPYVSDIGIITRMWKGKWEHERKNELL